jgi:hypothetical protein
VSRPSVQQCFLVDGLALGAWDMDKSDKLFEAPLKVASELLA